MANKSVRIGFCTLLDEEHVIRGWARMMLNLCDHVVALIDPTTTDKTEQILWDEFKDVEIRYQDRSLGDSDVNTHGPEEKVILNENITQFVREEIDEDEYFLIMAGDERFHPDDLPKLAREVELARKNGLEISHEQMYEFAVVVDQYTIWPPGWVQKVKFFRNHPDWGMRHAVHGTPTSTFQKLVSHVPLYHFPCAKFEKFSSWFYEGRGGYHELRKRGDIQYALYNEEMFDWKEMSELK